MRPNSSTGGLSSPGLPGEEYARLKGRYEVERVYSQPQAIYERHVRFDIPPDHAAHDELVTPSTTPRFSGVASPRNERRVSSMSGGSIGHDAQAHARRNERNLLTSQIALATREALQRTFESNEIPLLNISNARIGHDAQPQNERNDRDLFPSQTQRTDRDLLPSQVGRNDRNSLPSQVAWQPYSDRNARDLLTSHVVSQPHTRRNNRDLLTPQIASTTRKALERTLEPNENPFLNDYQESAPDSQQRDAGRDAVMPQYEEEQEPIPLKYKKEFLQKWLEYDEDNDADQFLADMTPNAPWRMHAPMRPVSVSPSFFRRTDRSNQRQDEMWTPTIEGSTSAPIPMTDFARPEVLQSHFSWSSSSDSSDDSDSSHLDICEAIREGLRIAVAGICVCNVRSANRS